jgi:hypothetical protein
MARDHPSSGASDGFPKRDCQGAAAVSMNKVRGAQAEVRDRESGCFGPFRQRARGGANDGLAVSSRAQASSQGEQRFLPSAPGFLGVHVNDGKRLQKNECSTFRPAARGLSGCNKIAA